MSDNFLQYDTSPGSPDGPPPAEKQGLFFYLGALIAIVLTAGVLGTAIVGIFWILAWLVTHFPGA